MDSEAVFRPKALEMVVDRFPDDAAHFPPFSADDHIASFFFTLALDMLSRTGRSLREAPQERRADFIASARTFFPGAEKGIDRRLQSFTEKRKRPSIDEGRVFLDMLREKYLLHIRGARPECWECLLLELEGEAGGERPLPKSCDCDRADEDEARRCTYYREGWKKTSLAVTAGERTIASAEGLARRIYEICPVLELLTDRRKLERHLFEEFFAPRAAEGKRSVRGVAVRLLTAFVESSLDELSRRLELPPERRLSLLS